MIISGFVQAQNVNAKIETTNGISCNPSSKIVFILTPISPAVSGNVVNIQINNTTPSSTVVYPSMGTLSKFELQGLGFVEYKVVGKFTVQDIYNNQHTYNFQSILDLRNNGVQFNSTTTTYTHPTTDLKTISVVNPVPGLIYRWYLQEPFASGNWSSFVHTGTSYNVNYGGGAKFYVVGLNSDGCTTSVGTAYRDLEEVTPPFEVVTGKFTLTQNCEAENANFIRPIRKDGTSEGLTWKWVSYPVNGSYVADPNKDLNLNKVKDGEAIVEVTDLDNNQIETFIFRIWGTESKYWGSINTTTNVITWNNVNLYGDLVVVKQFDENDVSYAQRVSYYAQNYGCQYTKFKIAANTKVLVLSGYKAFNRLLFLNNNEIEIGKGVEITSGCNMWGGIVIHEKSSLAIKGTKEQPVSISNANHAVLLNYPNRPINASWINYQPFFDANKRYFNVATGNDQALIQINYTNFHNNYYHIYCVQELRNGSYTSNSKFNCDPDLMLPPYEPQLIDGELQKFQTEACIVGYDGEKTYGEPAYQHQGFFPSYNTTNGVNTNFGVNISNCEFSNAFFGIRMPYQTKFVAPNKYKNISLAAIAFRGWHLDLADYEVSNQDITLPTYLGDSDYLKYFQHQSVNLEAFWNIENGYEESPNVSITDTEEEGLANLLLSQRSRVGLSIGRPDVFTTDVSTTIDAPMNYTFGIISDNMVSAAGYFGTNRAMIFRNNRISSSGPFDASKWNFHYGIYAGGIKELSNNRFFDLNYAASGQVGLFETRLLGNYFYNNIVGSRFFALEPLSGTILPFKMSCNTFDFDRGNTSQTYNGLVISGFANVPLITGSSITPTTSYRSANVWPVATGTNRSILPTDEDNFVVNVENLDFGWQSPPMWTSIFNNTNRNPDPNGPQIRNTIVYERYTNEFVGNVLPNNSPSLVKSPPLSPLLAFTIAANGPLVGSQYVEVCSNELTGSTIVFPTGRIGFGSTTINKNDLLINQASESNSINIQVPKETGNYNLIVSDVLGRKLLNEKGQGAHNYTTIPLQKGVLIVTLETEGKLSTQKIIVK